MGITKHIMGVVLMANNKEHTVLLLIGKTCAGKSTLAKMLSDRTGLRQLVSYTTRVKRNDNDTDHIFVDVAEYERAKANGEIVAETQIAGNYYYSTINQLYESDLYTVDPMGKDMLLSMNLPNIKFVVVYITCPDEERRVRSEKRGDDKAKYRVRDFSERQQFRQFVTNEEWDYSISNNDLCKAYSVLRWISIVEGAWKNHVEEDDINVENNA